MELNKQEKEEWLLHKGRKCLYKSCVFHNDNCGPYKRAEPVTDGVFGVTDLNEDAKPHFKFLKLKVDDENIFSEQQLTENCSVLTLSEDTKICAHHRYTFGTGYKPKKTCQHPHHTHQPKQVKAAQTRVAFFSVMDHTTKNYSVQYPIGGAVCNTHYKEKSVSKMALPTPGPAVEEDDTDYVPEVAVLTEGVLFSTSTVSFDLAKCLDASPVSTLKRTRFEDLNEKAKEDYKKKHKRMKESFKMQKLFHQDRRRSSWQNYCPQMTIRVMIWKIKFQKNWTVVSQKIKVEMPWKSWSSFPS